MLYQVVLPKELSKGKAETLALSCILICPDTLGGINQEQPSRRRPTHSAASAILQETHITH